MIWKRLASACGNKGLTSIAFLPDLHKHRGFLRQAVKLPLCLQHCHLLIPFKSPFDFYSPTWSLFHTADHAYEQWLLTTLAWSVCSNTTAFSNVANYLKSCRRSEVPKCFSCIMLWFRLFIQSSALKSVFESHRQLFSCRSGLHFWKTKNEAKSLLENECIPRPAHHLPSLSPSTSNTAIDAQSALIFQPSLLGEKSRK